MKKTSTSTLAVQIISVYQFHYVYKIIHDYSMPKATSKEVINGLGVLKVNSFMYNQMYLLIVFPVEELRVDQQE